MTICLLSQLGVDLHFLLIQTTKGASSFKICRGVEAVGGSLRSVTSNKTHNKPFEYNFLP